jgi:hypothetical protein
MELLIRAYGRGQNGNGDWERGDIINVREEGQEWGRQEDPRTRTHPPTDLFIILKVPGVARSAVREEFETHIFDENDELVRRGNWRVDLDSLPPGVVAQLNLNGGVATVGWGVIKQHIIYVPTGETAEVVDPETM